MLLADVVVMLLAAEPGRDRAESAEGWAHTEENEFESESSSENELTTQLRHWTQLVPSRVMQDEQSATGELPGRTKHYIHINVTSILDSQCLPVAIVSDN